MKNQLICNLDPKIRDILGSKHRSQQRPWRNPMLHIHHSINVGVNPIMLKNKKIKKKEENSNFTKIGTTPK
jgi:hypothetical protein